MSANTADRTYLVGRYWNGEEFDFLPLSNVEIVRAEWFYRRILDSFKLPTRSTFLLISMFDEGALTAPLERALISDNYVTCYAEPTTFDATRVESILRRFDVTAVMGVTSDTLLGLEQAGFSPATLFAGLIVWVRDEQAYAQLENTPGIALRRWSQIGPAIALECAKGGGLHFDPFEWSIDIIDNEARVTSRLGRIETFEQLATGVMATIAKSLCNCGCDSPKIILQ